MNVRPIIVLACFFLSGVAGLVYETAWTHELALVFGTSEPAIAAVLAAYMAGLALGAAMAARWVDRVRSPLRLYALIELGIGLAALAVPFGLAAARRVQILLLGGLEELPAGDGIGSTLFYLLASFVILLVPTSLMGATLPLLVRHAVREERDIGRRSGLLYAVNTAGAAGGVLLAAFVLLPRLALGPTVLVAVGLNALVAVLAWVLARTTRESAARLGREPLRAVGSSRESWVLPVMLLSGAVAFTWEILWTRLLTYVLGGSAYAFGTMLATFLAGIALGSLAAARLATSRDRARRGLAWSQGGVAVLSIAAFLIVDRLPALARELSVGAASLVGAATLSALTLLPGALAMGATFPFAVRLLSREAGEAGAAAARVYSWNTLGAIVGALGAGFVLLPRLEFTRTAVAAAAVSLLLAAAISLRRPRVPLVAGLAVVLFSWLVVRPPATPWTLLRHSVLQNETAAGGASETRASDVAYFGVGRGATVTLLEQDGEWRLASNGLPESVIQPRGARPGRYQIARWLSLLPLAVRPETETMLVIGLGGGNTVEYVPAGVRSISVVELEAEIVAANRYLSGRRAVDPQADPRVELHVSDARSALHLSERRFDAIVSQPSHPWTSGASHLFTREFFSLARERLRPGGVLVQWIGLAFVDEALIRVLVATLTEVFANVEVYQPTVGALLFVASEEALNLEAASRTVAAAPAEWRVVGVRAGEDLLATRLLDDTGSRALAVGAPINRDRRNLLQVRSPRALADPIDRRRLDEIVGPLDPLVRELPPTPLHVTRQLLRRGRARRAQRLVASLPPGPRRLAGRGWLQLAAGRQREASRAFRQLLAAVPDDEEALAGLLLLSPQYGATMPSGLRPSAAALDLLEGRRLARAGDWSALEALDPALATIEATSPLHGEAVRLRIEWRRYADPQRAREALDLLEPSMVPAPLATDLALRADLGRMAGASEVALASLLELSSHPAGAGLKTTAMAIFDLLPAAAAVDPRYSLVADWLERSGGAAPAESVSVQ